MAGRRAESRRCALVLISHDRRFLDNLSRATVWLDRGQIRQIDRGFGRSRPGATRCWPRRSSTATSSTARSPTRSTGCATASPAAASATRRLGNLHALRDQRRDTRRDRHCQARGGGSRQSGKLVIEAKNIAKAYGGRPIVEDFSTRVQRGDRIGIVGPNGAGKTTLINC